MHPLLITLLLMGLVFSFGLILHCGFKVRFNFDEHFLLYVLLFAIVGLIYATWNG